MKSGKSSQEESPTVSCSDLWIMLLSMVRYSMGRRTYMPDVCYELYCRYRSWLTPFQKNQLAEEIRDEMKRAKLLGRELGDHCDHKTWERLTGFIERELTEYAESSDA